MKLPVFKGKEEDYQVFIKRFVAFARVKGFATALKAGYDKILPKDENTWEGLDKKTNAKEYRAGVLNNVAIAQLTLALDDPSLMTLIAKSESDEWPGSIACKVMEALEEKYNPMDRISRVEMRRRLAKVKMGKKENPDTLFHQLAAIESQYNTDTAKLDMDEKIAVILEKAPVEYANVLAVEERVSGKSLDCDKLQ